MAFNLDIEKYSENDLKNLFNIQNESFANSMSIHEVVENRYNMLVNTLETSMKPQNEIVATKLFLTLAKDKLKGLISVPLFNELKETGEEKNLVPFQLNGNNKDSTEKKVTRIISVDTRFKDEDNRHDTNNFQITFPEKFNKIEKMELIEFSGPTSVRVISSNLNNNHFAITITYFDNSTSTRVIKIPDVYHIERNIITNATIETFIENVNQQMTDSGGDFALGSFQFDHEVTTLNYTNNPIISDRTLSFVYNTSTSSKLITSVQLDFTLDENGLNDNTSIQKKLGYLLGFRDNNVTLIPRVNQSNILTITASSLLDLNSFKYAYLVVDDFHNNSERTIIASDLKNISAVSTSLLNGGNILGKIIYRNELNYNLANRVISTERNYNGQIDIQKLKVSLINEYGDFLDTKNLEWSFTLRITSSYK